MKAFEQAVFIETGRVVQGDRTTSTGFFSGNDRFLGAVRGWYFNLSLIELYYYLAIVLVSFQCYLLCI